MVTINTTAKKIVLHLFKEFSTTHTITSLAQELKVTRVGIWKILKKLEEEEHYLIMKPIGRGKTSTKVITLNGENPLVEKALALYLTEEAVGQRRWQITFTELRKSVDFVILYGSVLHSSQQANDIDIVCVVKREMVVKIQKIVDTIQKTQSKKIHILQFTKEEFKNELQKPNKAFIDAIKKGVVLFGQENFIRFMREIQ